MLAEFSDYSHSPVSLAPEGESLKRLRRCAGLQFANTLLPAHEAADELAGAILAQILEQDGHPALILPLGPALHDRFGKLDVGPTDVLCVSALPRYSFAPTPKSLKATARAFPKAHCVRLLVRIYRRL
jgi:hypothetical protein